MMESVLSSKSTGKTISQIIKETCAGRNTSFSALKWLEKNGFVRIESFGRQKLIYPVIDNYTLQYKYFLDAFRFKSLHSLVKLIVKMIAFKLKNEKDVQGAILFGSALKNDSIKKILHSDIDILILGKKEAGENLLRAREQIERIFGVLVNFHFSEFNIDEIFKGISVYQISYIDFNRPLEKQYFEFLDWIFAALKSEGNKKLYEEYLEKARINLAYCYSYLEGHFNLTKKEALEMFAKNCKVNTFENIQTRGIEIGEKIFN